MKIIDEMVWSNEIGKWVTAEEYKLSKEEIINLGEKFIQECIEIYGLSKFQRCSPYLEVEKNIYCRYSGDEDAEGEQSPDAEYDRIANSIVVYFPKIKSLKHLAETIIHEFQHYLQSPSWMARYYKMGYTYDNHPYELAALKEESK